MVWGTWVNKPRIVIDRAWYSVVGCGMDMAEIRGAWNNAWLCVHVSHNISKWHDLGLVALVLSVEWEDRMGGSLVFQRNRKKQ